MKQNIQKNMEKTIYSNKECVLIICPWNKWYNSIP